MSCGGVKAPAMAAVGMFDGVHRGHAFLLGLLARKACEAGMKPLALTFAHHPKALLHPESSPRLLTSPEQRCTYIKDKIGVDAAVLDLDVASLRMTAREFLAYINEKYGVEALLMGYDNHIGSDRRTGAELAAEGLPVFSAPPCPDVAVCSSAVREALGSGDISRANALLGHNFAVEGVVAHGQHIGSTIGFPTANVQPDEPMQLLPADGVYAVDAILEGKRMRGMANIGKRPTVNGENRTFEVHILDFDGDIYGRHISVEVLARLRDERRFPSLDALKDQLAADALSTRKI